MKSSKSFLLRKLEQDGLFDCKGYALELGFGNGEDTMALAQCGYQVDAVDNRQEFIEKLKSVVGEQKLSVNVFFQPMEEFKIEEGKYNLIFARNSLPFLKNKEAIFNLIKKLVRGLSLNGKICFTLFGPKDGWAGASNISFIEYDEVNRFLETLPIKLHYRSSEESYGKTMKGDTKFWHIHSFIYIKKT
ncbi:class I SAM-dependent methyltransferase [Candidatus Parcubacteria bacterium]|nr:MAG: class I SAM-dependent methyltransferase [Candidatus Parcubacteria bacterium]